MESQTERRPEPPDTSDAMSYIRFGMDLATRSDIQVLRGEFNQRFDTLDKRVDGLAAEVAALRAAMKTIGWVVATLVAVIGVALVAIQVFG